MARKVENIIKLPKDRVRILFEDGLSLTVREEAASGIIKGDELSRETGEVLRIEQELLDAWDRALGFIKFRPRSSREVVNYLRGRKYPEHVIDQTVERLSNDKILDDEAFARYWVNNRELFKPRGIHGLRWELKQKGIPDAFIEGALSLVDEEASAWSAVESRLKVWKRLEKMVFKKKMVSFLMRRGFSYEISAATFNRAWTSVNDRPESGIDPPAFD